MFPSASTRAAPRRGDARRNGLALHGGTTRELSKGQTAFVAGGKVELGEVPTSLLLKSRGPKRDARANRRRRFAHSPERLDGGGERRAGFRGAGRNGTASVTLQEGDNKLRLEARDVAGNALVEDSA